MVLLEQTILALLGISQDDDNTNIDAMRTTTQQQQYTQTLVTVFLTLLSYHVLFGNRHMRKRRKLAKELTVAKEQLTFLEEKLRRPSSSNLSSSSQQGGKKEIRIFMEGAFDLKHFGHMNAFRLGRSLGTHLVVGVNSDESITQCKAAPLMNDEERLAMVKSCKFVDEVVPNTPYIMSKEYIDYIFETYNVDYIIHGDDPCIVDGRDVYETAKQAGKFRTIPRTEGVSTTDILGRMLLLTKEHHHGPSGSALGTQSKFLTTTRLLQLFSANVESPTEDMRVIYIDGAWDMFHPGHVALLKAAKARGDYLIVGIHSDLCVNKMRGTNLPLLNLHERVLSVLGCRFVDDVLIDAPYEISSEMIASLRIAEVVVHGEDGGGECGVAAENNDDRYKHAREKGILRNLQNPSPFNMKTIFERIRKNQETFTTRFERKMNTEAAHYKQKYNGSSSSSS
jgi:ethanolamine-phosphate cytidylyltransferase